MGLWEQVHGLGGATLVDEFCETCRGSAVMGHPPSPSATVTHVGPRVGGSGTGCQRATRALFEYRPPKRKYRPLEVLAQHHGGRNVDTEGGEDNE